MVKTLIIEDNDAFRKTFRSMLGSHYPAMTFIEAKNGEEALSKYNDYRPDLIFVDIKLPGENGLEITKKIRVFNPDVNIIVLTNHDLPEYREAATQYGANHFISKGSSSSRDILLLIDGLISEIRHSD